MQFRTWLPLACWLDLGINIDPFSIQPHIFEYDNYSQIEYVCIRTANSRQLSDEMCSVQELYEIG